MNTKEYLQLLREKTGFNDYKISKELNINQSNLSKYTRGTATLSESHAFLFASVLNISPAQIIANTKLEKAKLSNNADKIKLWQEYADKYTQPISKELNIDIAQINPILADLDANAYKIIEMTKTAKNNKADIVVFPELSAIGYPPEDLLLRNNFIVQVSEQTKFIVSNLAKDIYVIFGTITSNDDKLYNSAIVTYNNAIVGVYHKRYLPNYGVFDEKRYFSVGDKELILQIKNNNIAVVICEDIWVDEIIAKNQQAKADTIITINASPFQANKYQKRLDYIINKALKYNINIVYANCVGGQDEVVFDGGSFIVNKKGQIIANYELFKETINTNNNINNNYLEEELVYKSLVLATRDYIIKNNFKTAILGLSGGIDSALILAIVVDAIGANNTQVLIMPSPYTSDTSLIDAQTQANTMGVSYSNIPIQGIMTSFDDSLMPLFAGKNKDVTEENIQARIRGSLLMALANKNSHILITTGNKSEYATGYATLYGDMNGGFAPLKDVYKLMVYRLAKYRNSISDIIPPRVITKEPSAELKDNQKDTDSLPDYKTLDTILYLFIERKLSSEDIINLGYDKNIVKKIINMVLKNEYKRRQSAPGPKISKNAFGKERRYPITSKFRA